MKSVIPFRKVLSRKFDVGNVYGNGGYVLNYGALTANPTHTNVKLFVEFGVSDSPDIKFNQTLDLVNLLKEEDRDGLTDTILNLMDGIVNLENAIEKISSSKFDSDSKNELIERCNVLEACDRVLRNRAKIQKRFNFDKVIRENKYGDLKHTVNELCALIDTYDISSKAKLNIAIENINYSFLASGNEQNVNEVTDYIVGYFLSRSPIITDKDANGYIDVLENNLFIDKDSIPAYHTMIYNRDNEFGCTFVNAINNIAVQCESAEMTSLIESMPRITTEKTASGFMDRFKKLCQEETIPDSDIMNGIKAFCTLPLIGSINSEFICYQLDKQIDLEIKDRIKDYEGDITVSTVIKNNDLVTMSEFVSSITEAKALKDDEDEEQIDLLEALLDNDNFKKDIESFKTSQKKTPSAFKALINKALTKSPEALLDEAPDLLALGRGMIYICIAALLPYGPVIAGISMLIMKLIGMKLNINKAKQLMRHLKKEKEAAVKKKDKLKSDKEKKATEEYIACLDKGIKKLADYILDIDDEDDEASDASIGSLSKDDDEFDFGDDNDDFDFGDFSFEEAVSFTGRLLEAVIDIEETSSVFIPNIPSYLVGESLTECSGLFSNCPKELRDQFYSTIDLQLKQSKDSITNTICTILLDSKDRDILEANTYAKVFLQRDAMKEAIRVVNEAFDLNTLKLAFVNFKNKAKQLKSKEQAVWRNIDIAASGLSKGFQRALTSDRREAIIKGSIIPSFSKIIKSALAVGAVGAFTGPVGAAITALGGFAVSKSLNHKERMLIYDEIDTELQVVEKQLQLAESEGDMNQYRFLLNYQKKLQREKQRIKYGIKMQGRDLPEIKGGDK